MSQTWSLVCHETQTKIWIGQGGGRSCLYTGDPEIMGRLSQFLVDHANKELIFLCDDTDWDCLEYTEYKAVPDTELYARTPANDSPPAPDECDGHAR